MQAKTCVRCRGQPAVLLHLLPRTPSKPLAQVHRHKQQYDGQGAKVRQQDMHLSVWVCARVGFPSASLDGRRGGVCMREREHIDECSTRRPTSANTRAPSSPGRPMATVQAHGAGLVMHFPSTCYLCCLLRPGYISYHVCAVTRSRTRDAHRVCNTR